MAAFTRINGAGFTSVDVLYSTSQLDAYLITIKNDSDTAIDLTADDGTVEGKVEQLMREISPLMYFVDDGSNGTVHVIVDNHATDAAVLQSRVRNIFGAAGTNGANNDSTVVLGGAIAVSAGNNSPVQTGDS
jgi:hypothetical protein